MTTLEQSEVQWEAGWAFSTSTDTRSMANNATCKSKKPSNIDHDLQLRPHKSVTAEPTHQRSTTTIRTLTKTRPRRSRHSAPVVGSEGLGLDFREQRRCVSKSWKDRQRKHTCVTHYISLSPRTGILFTPPVRIRTSSSNPPGDVPTPSLRLGWVISSIF